MSQSSRSFFFGATLAEIGFILFFALLLFAFFQKMADNETIVEDERVIEELERQVGLKESQLQMVEQVAQMSPEEQDRFFSELIPIAALQAENEKLSNEKEQLTNQLEELSTVKEILKRAAEKQSRSEEEIKEALKTKDMLGEVSPEQLAEALKLQSVIEDFNANSEDKIDSNEKLAQRLVDSRRVSDLQGQVRNLQGRLGGRDLPPCWAHRETGRIEYLFNVVIRDDGLVFSSAAPDYRMREYVDLVNTAALTAKLTDLATFETLAKPILDLTNAKGCRHYVSITDRSKNEYKATLTIEDYFYKFVNRT